MTQKQGEIKLEAVLSAILFYLGTTEKIKVKPDDASPEIEIEVTPVGIMKEDEALVCVIPVEKVFKYASIPYEFKVIAKDGHLIIAIEKQYNKTALYTANGQRAVTSSPTIDRLLTKLSGGEIEFKDTVENT